MQKHICKKVISFVLALIMTLTFLPMFATEDCYADTKPIYELGSVSERVQALKKKFPEGKYWNHKTNQYHNNVGIGSTCKDTRCVNVDSYTDHPCSNHNGKVTGAGQYDCNNYDGAIQCMGFASKLFYDFWGQNRSQGKKVTNPSFDEVRVGDYLRINGDTHSVFVIEKGSNYIKTAECNKINDPCVIFWNTRTVGTDSLKNINELYHSTKEMPPATSVKASLDSFMQKYPDGSTWTDKFDGGIQCYGFAKLVMYNLFGKASSGKYRSWYYDASILTGMVSVGSVTSFSASNVQSLLNKAQCGDVLQFASPEQHSMIVYSVETDGVWIYDCNSTVKYNFPCAVSLRFCKFGNWSNKNSTKFSLLRADSIGTGSPSVSFSPWNSESFYYVNDTDASLGQKIVPNGGTCTETGMQLFDADGNYLATGKNDFYNADRPYVYFKINEECGYTLKHATTYKYKFYAVVNGQTYWSDESSFTTTGAHFYSSKVTKDMTCTAAGTRKYTCSCGESYTETTAALGHDKVNHGAKAPTCTEKGWNAYVTCSRCDYTTYSELAALGHNFVRDAARDIPATVSSVGFEAYSCRRCNKTDDKVTEKLKEIEIVKETAQLKKLSGKFLAIVSNLTKNDFIKLLPANVVLSQAKGKDVLYTGMTITLNDSNGNPVDKMTVIVMGDVNCDGKVSAADARLALRNAVGLETLSGVALEAAKVSGATQVRAAQARIILRAAVGLETPESLLVKRP